MIYLRVSNSLMLIYLILTLCYNIHSAPTHHLTIGVQGNTPTLIVTSSEIGITPETMGSTKKLIKTEYAAKTYKDLDAGKKPIKTKLNKNQSVFNKKEKLQYLAKPLNKQISMGEKSSHIMKSLVDQEKTQKILKEPLNKQISMEERSSQIMKSLVNQEKTQKILKEPREHTSTTTLLLKDQETTTQKFQDFKTTTSPATDAETTRENVEIYKTNLHLTTLPPEQINDIQLTTTTSTAQPEEVSTTTPQANTDTTSPPPLRLEDVDDLKIPPALSTTLNPKDFYDISTTINYEDATNIATISKALTKMQTETQSSVVEKTTQILQDTTVIKTENETDNDSYTPDPVATTENENLLLTTIETKAFTTPATPAADASSTPTLVTLTADNEEATTTAEMLSLPLTMTTTSTENVVDDDSNNNNDNKNEQQQHTTIEYTETTTTHTITTTVSDIEELDKEAENPAEAESQDNINSDVTLKLQQEHATQQTDDDFKSTENPLQVISVATTQANLNKQNKTEIETITETEDSVVTSTTPLTNEKPQAFTTFQTHQQDFATTPDPTDNPHESSTDTVTTEAVLKLIDLEKHVLKTIDELKQPSSLLMAGQHDNGHDGLKNIKKKQLIDKHYVEALLHNKQDVHAKDSIENEKYLQLTTQASTTTTSSSTSAPSTTAASTKPLLMPIKHGYLGPILMEEKTFHVIHHADKAMTTRNKHLADIEAQLRKGHFMELKAKTYDTEAQQQAKENTNKNTKSFSSMEMQSDQPAEDSELTFGIKDHDRHFQQLKQSTEKESSSSSNTLILDKNQINSSTLVGVIEKSETNLNMKHNLVPSTKSSPIENPKSVIANSEQGNIPPSTEKSIKNSFTATSSAMDTPQEESEQQTKSATVLSTTVFQVIDSVATKTPMVQANTLFTSADIEKSSADGKQQTESKISDIQIEVYDSTVDSIVASTNFKDSENTHQSQLSLNDDSSLGKTTKPPIATLQQERFTQYVIDRTETSTQEPINYSTIQVANGKPEPAAIEIHINVSESFGNESEDLEFSYPQSEYINNNNNDRIGEESYDDIKLKIPSNSNNNNGKELRADEILVVEIIDTDNITDSNLKVKTKNTDELFITDVKELYTTPPPPPPPPPYQNNFDRDSDTIFYISNTEVKVGESLPATNNVNEERKLKLESQFFPANYMASTHPNVNSPEELNAPHHLYEEDIILSSSRNQADSLKIYRNRNEPSPPLDVTYVGESIIEVEQSPDSVLTTTYAPDQQHNVATQQADVIIQPALLPEISIGVPVIGELPPQIELKEIDFMPNEAQLHRSGIYDDNESSNNNIMFNNDIDENTISGSNNNHDVDIVNGNSNSNNNQRVDESSIQYGGDLIDESADGGFDGVEGSYPFGNPAAVGKSSSSAYSSAFMTKLRKQQQQQQPNHVADYAHLYINYGVNNMRKDELSADVKDSGELLLIGVGGGGVGGGNINVASVNSNEQNITSFKDFLNKASMSNSTIPFMSVNSTQNERMSNATAFSVMEDANDLEDKNTEDIINLISLAIGLFIVILPVVVTCSMFWALRYLYKKYHSNITDSGGYTDQTETKSPLNEDGVEKGEFVHEPSSSPTNSTMDAIEKYPDTSNKPSTTETNVKFSTEKPTSHLETTSSSSKTNTTDTTTNSTSVTASKTNDTLKLSLALSFPITQEQAIAKPPPSASSPSIVATTTEHILTVHGDVDNENGDDDDDVEMPGPNGSITKMTLENNLLIVETEERNDISRVARETKMDYNKDGVFVVEVARGIDSKNIPESPVTDGNEKMLSMFETKQNNGGLGYKVTNEKNCINNEKVQIHSPPPENAEEGPRSLHQIEEVEEPTNSPHLNENNADDEIVAGLAYKANTGLSQSDLSTTSSSDSNKGYCYGNQELYVVEHSGYSTVTPNRNVVLKCDVKDIKDDDRNPGNDHYLKHSPDKREESKDKQDIVETTKQPEEGNSRTSSGESPAQKQNDKAQEKETNAIEIENIENVQVMERNNSDVNEEHCVEDLGSCNESAKLGSPVEIPLEKQNIPIPVEIEVHITPAEIENSTADETLSPVKSTTASESPVLKATESVIEVENIFNAEIEDVKSEVIAESAVLNATESETEEAHITPAETENTKTDETLSPVKSTVTAESPVLKATESITEPLVLETLPVELEDALAVETLLPIDTSIPINNETSTLLAEEDVLANSIPDDDAIIAVPDKFSDKETPQDAGNLIKDIQEDIITLENHVEGIENVETVAKELEVEKELVKADSTNGVDIKENSSLLTNGNSECKETAPENNQDKCVTKNGLMSNSNLQINGANEVNELELAIEENTSNAIQNELNKTETQNGLTQSNEVALTNGTDLVKSPQLQNGHADVEPISISLNDMENGYDSIMSLPEPPPTTDEQLNSDLSDQQLDSLPPPPPPEIFNLKDLPPPLTNGTADSPQSEESNKFYNTLPPPPPTTLEVTASADTTTTATNGKVHASPLTPPASPPAHFTNNLHAGLCSQPIAVDVNGS